MTSSVAITNHLLISYIFCRRRCRRCPSFQHLKDVCQSKVSSLVSYSHTQVTIVSQDTNCSPW